MTPRAFSFNSPHGACPECQGLGAVYDFDPARIVPDDTRVARRRGDAAVGAGDDRLIAEMLEGLRRTFGIDPTVPFAKLPKKQRDIVLFGAPGRRAPGAAAGRSKPPKDPFGVDFEGAIPNLRRRFEDGHVDRPGSARAVPRAAAVSGLRRRAAQAREPARSA